MMVGEVEQPKRDLLELASRWLTRICFLVAAFSCIAGALLAMAFVRQPFPGILVEQTLVVTGDDGPGWPGRMAGMEYPERVRRVDGIAVDTAAEFQSVIWDKPVGSSISMLTELPNGTLRLYPGVNLVPFNAADTVRLFFLPFVTAVLYLLVGVWIFRVRGHTRPGRALAFFCACTAIAASLLFDLDSTHAFSALWTVAVALLGGALLSLAMRFPVAWRPAERHPWLLAIPYLISIGLAVYGIAVLYDGHRPWAYVSAWAVSYRYCALGILVFLGLSFQRAFSPSETVRRQARIILLGAIVSFGPLFVYFAAPVAGLNFMFNAALLLPELVVFPAAVAVAILRHRLLEMDVIVNRTIVYGLLTAILAGMVAAGTLFMRNVFVSVTGEKSDTALVTLTLIVAAAFVPLKERVQRLVDAYFKQLPDNTRELRSFTTRVQSFVELSDPRRVARQFVEQTCVGLLTESAALSLVFDGRLATAYTWGAWRGNASVVVPLECEGERMGLLALGPRLTDAPYTQAELDVLQEAGAQVACALRLIGPHETPSAQRHGLAPAGDKEEDRS